MTNYLSPENPGIANIKMTGKQKVDLTEWNFNLEDIDSFGDDLVEYIDKQIKKRFSLTKIMKTVSAVIQEELAEDTFVDIAINNKCTEMEFQLNLPLAEDCCPVCGTFNLIQLLDETIMTGAGNEDECKELTAELCSTLRAIADAFEKKKWELKDGLFQEVKS